VPVLSMINNLKSSTHEDIYELNWCTVRRFAKVLNFGLWAYLLLSSFADCSSSLVLLHSAALCSWCCTRLPACTPGWRQQVATWEGPTRHS